MNFDPVAFILRHQDFITIPGGMDPQGRDKFQVLSAWISPGERVLDVGFGWGALGAILRTRGCEVVGVERDPALVAQAGGNYHRALAGSIEEDMIFAQLGGGFHTIALVDVLEHLVAPEKTLLRLREQLIPGGKLVLCVPNIAHWSVRAQLLAGNFDYQDSGLLDRTHLHFFTRRSLGELLVRTGYQLQEEDFLYAASPLDTEISDPAARWALIQAEREFFALEFLVLARAIGVGEKR